MFVSFLSSRRVLHQAGKPAEPSHSKRKSVIGFMKISDACVIQSSSYTPIEEENSHRHDGSNDMLLPIMQALAPCRLWQVAGGSTGLSLAALSMDKSNIGP